MALGGGLDPSQGIFDPCRPDVTKTAARNSKTGTRKGMGVLSSVADDQSGEGGSIPPQPPRFADQSSGDLLELRRADLCDKVQSRESVTLSPETTIQQ
jgi:hypothetical protein